MQKNIEKKLVLYEFILSIHASLLCPTILQYSALSGVNYLDLSLHWSSIFLDQLFYSEKIEDMKYMFKEERRPGGKPLPIEVGLLPVRRLKRTTGDIASIHSSCTWNRDVWESLGKSGRQQPQDTPLAPQSALHHSPDNFILSQTIQQKNIC